MTSQHDKAKRWRPRFSLRTLAIVVTLVCCYAACWGPTQSSGIEDVSYVLVSDSFDPAERRAWLSQFDLYSPAPLVVATHGKWPARHYYFWFFGYVAKLPYEREVDWKPEEDLSDFPQTLDGDYIGH